MAEYRARMLHGRTGAEGIHDFDGPDDLFSRSPMKIMHYFMEHATEKGFHEHEDYEVYSALKNHTQDVVTVSGEFHYTPTSRSPFVVMIAPKEAG